MQFGKMNMAPRFELISFDSFNVIQTYMMHYFSCSGLSCAFDRTNKIIFFYFSFWYQIEFHTYHFDVRMYVWYVCAINTPEYC